MSEGSQSTDEPGEPFPEKRLLPRYSSGAVAVVIRETDTMRTGIDARVRDVSMAGVGIDTSVELLPNEQVKLTLKNEIQRFQKEVRGVVRHVTLQPSGELFVGVDLFTRLTPLDVTLLRMGIRDDQNNDGPVWM